MVERTSASLLVGLLAAVLLLGTHAAAEAQTIVPVEGGNPPAEDEDIEEEDLEEEDSDEEADPEIRTLEDVEVFLDNWDGDADELQRVYDRLPPQSRELVDSLVEFWAIEGGLGVLGGYQQGLGGDASRSGGLFRLEPSFGIVWPMGDYSMPIYYAVPDIPGPWALGFQVFAAADNFSAFSGGAGLRWAHEYIGTTPHVDIGPALRLQDGKVLPGAHLGLGYGNILLQGYLDLEAWVGKDSTELVAVAGVRIPWMLFLPSTWEILSP